LVISFMYAVYGHLGLVVGNFNKQRSQLQTTTSTEGY
jgi:hypothetical protein